MSQPVVIIPNIMFMGRRIYLQKFNILDNEAEKHAVALSQIMKERIFSKKADKEPKIKIATPL
jgi:hypothetical protein